jgi:tetratricopeptide (TPR) repeat protein
MEQGRTDVQGSAMGELRSRKQQREQLVGSLRAVGKSWVEVAAALRQRYRFNARVAFRYAHGWSQRQAADKWNQRWPDELKTFKMFSYWEMWPSATGHAPSFGNLSKLAELYECVVSDLLVDLPDFRHRDATGGLQTPALTMPQRGVELVVPDDSAVGAMVAGLQFPDHLVALLMQHFGSLTLADRERRCTPRDRDQAYHQLVQCLRSWAHTMDRRDALRVLATWVASAASVLPALNGDEHARVASVLRAPGRVDAQTIEHIDAVLWHCRQQDYALGPQAVLSTVLAQRDLARALLPDCPAALRPRMLSALSEASRLAGWLSFDLQQFDHAGYYYEDARALAHEAENAGLGAFVLCEMSHLATWQGTPRIGIDHAVAARYWADRTGDLRLRAYTADVAARAYAADGQRDACLNALDTAHTVLTSAHHHAPSYISTYDEAIYISIRGSCHLKLGEVDPAVSYAQQSLKTLDRSSFSRDVAMTIVDLSEAYVQGTEIDEAARLLGDAAAMAAANSSARLIDRLVQARAGLQTWQDTAAVRALDERLVEYGVNAT